MNKVTITLDKEQAVDIVALLLELSMLTKVWFRDHEPASAKACELSKTILYKSIDAGLIVTEQQLRERSQQFRVSDLDIGSTTRLSVNEEFYITDP